MKERLEVAARERGSVGAKRAASRSHDADGLRTAVVLLGPPGAGKGTQARRIGEYFHFPRISTGDMLREAVKKGSALGKKARGYIESGELVPDGLVDALVKARVARKDCDHGFVLDGYPRTIHQAEYLERLFPNGDLRILALGIQVHDNILLERLAGRWTCSKCGKIFNAASNQSSQGNRCDECGTLLVHRNDDSLAVVEERLQVYHNVTKPLIDYYRKRRCYFMVDGEQPMDVIYEKLKETIARQKEARQAGA